MKTSESWDLSSIGDISVKKIERNLRELSVFSGNSIRSFKDIAFRYDPISLLEYAALNDQSLQDEAALRLSSALISYLVNLASAYPKPLPKAKSVKPKDFKELYRLFEDITRKAIRSVDNTALSLKAERILEQKHLLSQYQGEASAAVLPLRADESLLREQHQALRYQLQPFNTLISECFPSHLDGLLHALLTLVEKKEANITVHTTLGEDDVRLLSLAVGSREFKVDNHRLTMNQESRLRPFLTFEGAVYCFDPGRVLASGYEIIKTAVISTSEERKRAWEEIEAEKQSLLPITFFTAMLGSMHYSRNVPYEGGYLDAVFEDGNTTLVLQIPAAHTTFPADVLLDSAQYAQSLIAEAQALKLAKNHPNLAVIIDIRMIGRYPIALSGNTLTLSFLQVANLATTWEGANEIKGVLGLLPFSNLRPSEARSGEEDDLNGKELEEVDDKSDEDVLASSSDNLEDEFDYEEDEDELYSEDEDGEILLSELDEIDDEDEYEEELAEFEGDEADEYTSIDYEDDEYEQEEGEEEIAVEEVPESPPIEPAWQKFDQGFTLGYQDPPIIDAEYLDYEDEDEEEDEIFAGSSYFTSSDPLEDYLDEDEYETADEMVSQSEQPVLFDLEDEQMFDPLYRTLQEQEAEDEDYESEARGLFESEFEGDDDDDVAIAPSLVLADEEMEEGKEDLLRYHTQYVEDDDGDEFGFLNQIQASEESARPSSRFTLINAVEHAKDHGDEEDEEIQEAEEVTEAVGETVEMIEPFTLELPEHLGEVFALLAQKNRWEFNSYLKTAPPHVIDSLERMLIHITSNHQEAKEDRMFTIAPLELTIIVLASKGDTLSAWTRKVNVAALMYTNGKTHWRSLSIGFDRNGELIFADESMIKRQEFTPTDWKFVLNAAQRLSEKKRK